MLNNQEEMQCIPTDSLVISSAAGDMEISLKGKEKLWKKDLMVLEMLAKADWKRPIYTSISLGPDDLSYLRNHLVLEGLAYRISPTATQQRVDVADGVRVACGCFEQDFKSKDRPRAESWRKGYRVAGYFLYWLQLNKDKNFLRKFNASAAELNPWSWDKAMKHVLGDKPENGVEELWNEYLHAIGDK